MLLKIADIGMAFVRGLEDPPLFVDAATSQFLVPGGTPDVTVAVGWGDLSHEAGGEPLFDSGSVWRLYRQGDGFRFQFRSAVLGKTPYRTAAFDARFTTGEVCLHRPYFETGRAAYPLEYPLDELLMIALLGLGRGIEVHGCGVIDRSGTGCLFVGQSGAGKTTLARLWRREEGVTILSDDRLVLRSVGDRIWMYGTPWHGDEPLASPRGVPLSHIFFLRHATEDALAPVTGASAAARLFASSFPPFHSAPALDFTLELLERIVGTVPCQELSFVPSGAVIDLVRAHAA